MQSFVKKLLVNFRTSVKDFQAPVETSSPLHCEKSWRKTPPAWPDVTDSLVRGTENFFNMKIKLIRRRRRSISKSSEFPDGFLFAREGVLRQFSVNFPTHESSKASSAGLDPTSFRFTIHYSTTAPHSLVKICNSTMCHFLSTCLASSVLCFPSSVLC